MSAKIHSTAIIEDGASLGENVEVGPYCLVGKHVEIGDGCVLRSHVNLEGYTQLGSGNVLFPFCSVGAPPQDLKYQGEKTWLRIGEKNVIRESVTIQPGTVQGGGETRIGKGNLFMAYSHVAHDCVIGDGNILANGVQLSGHVIIDNGAVLGGLCGIHQFCRIGDLAMLGGGSMVVKDVPPFAMGQGDHCSFRGFNTVGMRRKGMKKAEIEMVKLAYRHLVYQPKATIQESINSLRQELEGLESQICEKIIAFYESSERGVIRKHDEH